MYPPPGVLRPEERLQQHYQQDYQLRDLDSQGRDLDYQRGLQGKSGTALPRVQFLLPACIFSDGTRCWNVTTILLLF